MSLAGGACGGGPGEAAPLAPEAAFPVEVAGTSIPAAPQRIVSASASHTEILFALGAGPRVVATDQFSNYPPEAAATAKVDAFNASVETLAAFRPDLVVLSFDPGDVQDGLAALGIPTLLFGPPERLDDVYAQIEALGAATGLQPEAAALVAAIDQEVRAIVAAVPAGGPPLTYYYELDPTLYSVTSATFIGGLFALLGLQSIADAADPEGSGFPQLSAEFILAADPDFIILADTRCCGQSAATVAARPGWSSLRAVAETRVLPLDDDVASRWGPRLVDLLRQVADGVYSGEGPG